MNAALKYLTWTLEELEAYFGLKKDQESQYRRRLDFRPGVLSVVQPKQLHETKQHLGRYVHLDGTGAPDLRKDVVAILDLGFPYQVMAGAMEHLKATDWDAWKAMTERMRRFPNDTAETIAKRCGCDRSALYKRSDRGLGVVSHYLDLYLGDDAS